MAGIQLAGRPADNLEDEFAHADKNQPSYAAKDASSGTVLGKEVQPGQQGMASGSQARASIAADTTDEALSSESKSMLVVGKMYASLFCCIAGVCPTAWGKHLVTVRQGYVGVVLRFGRYHKVLPPGRHKFNIMSDSLTEVATRVAVLNVPKQSVLTKDNLSVEADAAMYYKVVDAAQATFAVDNFRTALANLGMVTVRAVVGEFTLERIFSKRLDLNERIKEVCSEQASTWGIEIDEITLLGVVLPNELEENMAAVAQSKRDAEAAMIRAEAAKSVAKLNAEAAAIIKSTPAALDLKWMETLKTVAANPARTIIVPPTQQNALTLLPGMR